MTGPELELVIKTLVMRTREAMAASGATELGQEKYLANSMEAAFTRAGAERKMAKKLASKLAAGKYGVAE